MSQHYYDSRGASDRLVKKLRERQSIEEEIKRIQINMRHESDIDRRESQARIDKLRADIRGLDRKVA